MVNSSGSWTGKKAKYNLDFFLNRLKKYVNKNYNILSKKEFDKIIKFASDISISSFNPPFLLHGDITGGNVIINSAGTVIFIDPGEIIGGDPMADLGYSQTSQCSPEFRNGVWRGYNMEEKLTPEENERFLRWKMLRQSIITCRAFNLKTKRVSEHIAYTKKLFNDLGI
jgi:fructosamine-3-kinase